MVSPETQSVRPYEQSPVRTDRLKPRHEAIRLEEELRTGEISLAQFAADLHEVPLAPGWDGRVLAEMQEIIAGRLHIQNHIGARGGALAPRPRALV